MPIVHKAAIKALTQKHPLFLHILNAYGPPPNWTREPGFASLSKIILEQQISLSAANAHFNKLTGFVNPYTPERLLQLTDEEMRACHISRQKMVYLRALALAIVAKQLDLENLQHLDEDEARLQLMQIKGIGQWTTDIYLMFCRQAKDIFPLGDIALINTIRQLTKAATKEEIVQLSATWKPYRSLAAYFLWHCYLQQRNRTVP
jgi:DNA-3-methyladenine glycosylase II